VDIQGVRGEKARRPMDCSLASVVANMFLKRNQELEAHHRNGIIWDNAVSNLKWVTPNENKWYASGSPTIVIVTDGAVTE